MAGSKNLRIATLKLLQQSDSDMIRALEDFIEVLMNKGDNKYY